MKPFSILLAGVALIGCSPAWAGTKLWQNIEVGMSADELKVLYPASKTEPKVKWKKRAIVLPDYPIGDCLAEVRIVTDKNLTDPNAIVTKVALNGVGCYEKTFRALVTKYGPTSGEDRTVERQSSALYNNDFRSAFWTNDDVTIRFKSSSGGLVATWNLIYEPVVDLGL